MSSRPIDPRHAAARRRLQDRYAELSGLPDASRLAYLRGPLVSWTEEEVAGLWATATLPVGTRPLQNNVYVHVPFCKSICRFCNYERLRPSSPAWLRAWLERLKGSLDTLAPAVGHLEFHTLYLGGGTPSTLPATLLEELLTALDERLRWHPRSSREFEFDPAVMSGARLDVLQAHGFQRFSFGIQTLDAGVNQAHDRGPQGVEVVARRFAELEERGLDAVSCDFLFGLAGTTPERVFEEMDTVLRRFRPLWIDAYLVTPTLSYVEGHFGGSYEAFWAHLKPFQEQAEPAIARLAKAHGYRVTEGHGHRMSLARPDRTRRRSTFGYSQLVNEQRRPMNLLGLGPSARSQIFGVAALQTRDPGDRPDAAGPARYEGHPVSLEDEARTFLVHHLRDADEVPSELFEGCFGRPVAELAGRAMAAWEAEGLLSSTARGFGLTPQDRLDRARSLLWLVPDQALEHELARRMALDLTDDGVARLVHPLPVGAALAGGARLSRVSARRIHLRVQGREVSVRVAPPLDDAAPLRLVVDRVPPALIESASPAVRQLTALVRRNHHVLRGRLDAERSRA